MPYRVVIYEDSSGHSSIKDFEEMILRNAEQEKKTKGRGPWTKLADIYTRQLERIRVYPYPEELIAVAENDDETPPSVKHITENTYLDFLYRWGIHHSTGNHRILYVIHNYCTVVLLHYFDKRYNGLIKRRDIQPAEQNYEDYCLQDPSLYPLRG